MPAENGKQSPSALNNGKLKAFTRSKPSETSENPKRFRPDETFHAQTHEINFPSAMSDADDVVLENFGDSSKSLRAATVLLLEEGLDLGLSHMYDELMYCSANSKALTMVMLLTVEDAKKHCFANWKIQNDGENTQTAVSEDKKSSHVDLPKVFSEEINQYLSEVKERKEKLEKLSHSFVEAEDIPDELIGFEHRLIGSVCYSLTDDDYTQTKGIAPNRMLYVSSISTQEAYRGFGVGKYLMEHVKSLVTTERQFDAVWLYAYSDVVGFYHKLGFREGDKNDYEKQFDNVKMVYILNNNEIDQECMSENKEGRK